MKLVFNIYLPFSNILLVQCECVVFFFSFLHCMLVACSYNVNHI